MPKAPTFAASRLDFSSPARLTTAVNRLTATEIGPAIQSSFAQSQGNALQLTSTLLAPGRPLDNSRLVVEWAGRLPASQASMRRVVIQAFQEQKQELLLVHRMAGLDAAETQAFVSDYLAAGGSMAALVEWLQLAGKALRLRARTRARSARAVRVTPTARRLRRTVSRSTRGLLGDIWGAISSAGSSLVNWIKNLANAVIDGAKSLAKAVGEIASKAVGEIADFIEALVKAGRSLASILAEAVKKGADTLKKFIAAALEAGRSLGEILGWAASQIADTARTVVAELLRLGRKLVDILNAAIALGASALRAIARALSAAGQTVAAILGAVAAKTLATIQSVIQGLLDAGRALRDLLIAGAALAAAAVRNVVQALINLGKSVAEILAAIASQVASVVQAIVTALLQAGRAALEILQWALGQARALAKAIVSALLSAGQSLLALLRLAWQSIRSGFRALLQALIDVGTRVGQILDAIARNLFDAARTALEGLLQIGIRLAEVVKSILVDLLEASRRGFFELLVAIGQTPLKILQAAAEAGGSLLFLAITVFFEIWGGYRSLTARERQEAVRVFGASIALDRVKIAAGNVPAEVANWINGQTPFTTMYLINFSKADSQRTDENFLRVLIHELTHVWQGVQVGPLYMLESVCSQFKAVLSGGDRNAAYTYTEQNLVDANGNFGKFNREQQAAIVEDYWIVRFSSLSTTGLPPVDLLARYASQVFRPIRIRIPRSATSRAPSRSRARPPARRRLAPA